MASCLETRAPFPIGREEESDEELVRGAIGSAA